jgi:Ca2+/Na+ antiporter
MKAEYRLAFGTALFLVIITVVYFVWSGEYTGTVMLAFGGAAYALLFGYLFLQAQRRHHLPRVEDRPDASQEEGAGEIGYFPAASIWPVGMGLGAVLLAVGLVYGVWYWIFGGILLVGAIIGFATEAEAH